MRNKVTVDLYKASFIAQFLLGSDFY